MTNEKLQEAIDLLYECRDVLGSQGTENAATLYKRVWEWCRVNRNAAPAAEPSEVRFGAPSHRFAVECEKCHLGAVITLGQGIVLGFQCSCGHYTKIRDAEKSAE